jgi:hypothetical protein
VDWQSSTRGMSQIWQKVKEESRIFFEFCFVLATPKNSLFKYVYFDFFFFPQKKTLCTLCTRDFFMAMVQNLANKQKKKTMYWVNVKPFTKYKLGDCNAIQQTQYYLNFKPIHKIQIE